MSSNIATVVDWYGPYTQAEAVKKAREWKLKGLYAAVGHMVAGTRGPRKLLYVGLSKNVATRIGPAHHKLGTIGGGKIWLGEVSVPAIPGRKKKTEPHANSVEWALVRFLNPPLNERKRLGAPDKSCIVVNRWWDYNGETGEYQDLARPAAGWPDIVEYDDHRGTANLIWLGKRARVKLVVF